MEVNGVPLKVVLENGDYLILVSSFKSWFPLYASAYATIVQCVKI